MELHEKLIRLRKQKGMSQLELAEALEVSRQAISKWEVGSAVPSTENLRGLSNLYGVSLDYLVGDKDFDSPLEVHVDETELIGSSIPDKVEATRKRRLIKVLAVIVCIWLCMLIFGILRHAILAVGLFIIGTAIPLITLITFLLLSKVVSYIWRKLHSEKV